MSSRFDLGSSISQVSSDHKGKDHCTNINSNLKPGNRDRYHCMRFIEGSMDMFSILWNNDDQDRMYNLNLK